jgi:hypothetical protein
MDPHIRRAMQRAQREEDDLIDTHAFRVVYFFVLIGIVSLYPFTKGHLETLAFIFIFVITGVMLFFTIVKLEVGSVAHNTLRRHRDRILYIGTIHWIIYGTLYFFTKVNIGIEWLAFGLQLMPAVIHLGGMIAKRWIDGLLSANAQEPLTMRLVIAALYAYNIIAMIPVTDDNILTAPFYKTIVRYSVFVVFYIVYVAVYNPYVCRTPGVVVEMYIITTSVLYVNFYLLFVTVLPTTLYLVGVLLYMYRDNIFSIVKSDLTAAMTFDDEDNNSGSSESNGTTLADLVSIELQPSPDSSQDVDYEQLATEEESF